MKFRSFVSVAGRWRQAGASVLAGATLAVVLVACGGGGGGGATTAQSFTSGPIGGLGSIIVNGVRFDDRSAQVQSDDDGSVHSPGELKLGMMVEVESLAIDDSSARAVATHVRFGSEIVGPVATVDAVAQTLRVLDQTVEIKPTTVFDDSLVGGFAGISPNQVLEIHAQFDAASGHYVATRIESEAAVPAFRLRGMVSALDTTLKTFKIGDAVVNYANIADADLPDNLANDLRVRVRLQAQPAQVTGPWLALSVRSGVRKVDDIGDARVRGLVTAFTSPQQFEVQGIVVDATNATFDPNPAAVQLGVLVEVRGQASAGNIVATRVKVRNESDDDLQQVELHGTVSALDATTFMLRGVKVDYSQVTTWKNGAPTDLANDKQVEVKGVWSADHSVLVAKLIEFES
jgi:hypothetical protein